MHELSIAQNIIDIAEHEAQKNNIKKVTAIEIEVGEISGIEPESLRFVLTIAVKNTILENATITITSVQGVAVCLFCMNRFDIHDLFTLCPSCGNNNIQIVKGKELQIKSIAGD